MCKGRPSLNASLRVGRDWLRGRLLGVVTFGKEGLRGAGSGDAAAPIAGAGDARRRRLEARLRFGGEATGVRNSAAEPPSRGRGAGPGRLPSPRQASSWRWRRLPPRGGASPPWARGPPRRRDSRSPRPGAAAGSQPGSPGCASSACAGSYTPHFRSLPRGFVGLWPRLPLVAEVCKAPVGRKVWTGGAGPALVGWRGDGDSAAVARARASSPHRCLRPGPPETSAARPVRPMAPDHLEPARPVLTITVPYRAKATVSPSTDSSLRLFSDRVSLCSPGWP